MRSFTVRERDVLTIGANCDLSEEDAESLAAIAHQLPSDALEWGHRRLRFGPYCGVLQTARLAIELLPKTDHEKDDATPRGLLVALLMRAGELRISSMSEAAVGQQSTHLLDLFIQDFCNRLKIALRGGPIARYIDQSDTLSTVRGRLDFASQIRNFDRSRIPCHFDERSLDNRYNQALKAVLRRLFGLARSAKTRAIVTSLVHRFEDVSDRPVTAGDIEALAFDRTIASWSDVFERAAWLLRGLFPDVRTGQTGGLALLFHMERLFERVLANRMRDACLAVRSRGLRVQVQGPSSQLATQGFRLRPDIAIIDQSAEVVAIVDAKWKRLDPLERNAGVSSADAYQMNAYATRYGCSRLALVYPSTSSCAPGTVTQFTLETPGRPTLDILAVHLSDLAFGHSVPNDIETMIADCCLICSPETPPFEVRVFRSVPEAGERTEDDEGIEVHRCAEGVHHPAG